MRKFWKVGQGKLQVRVLGFEECHQNKFSGFSFSFMYPDWELKKPVTEKYKWAQTLKKNTPNIHRLSLAKNQKREVRQKLVDNNCSTLAKYHRENSDAREGQVRSWDLHPHQMVTSTWPPMVSVEPSHPGLPPPPRSIEAPWPLPTGWC